MLAKRILLWRHRVRTVTQDKEKIFYFCFSRKMDEEHEELAGMDGKKKVACSVCSMGCAKYKCPRCLVQTCSLACVKRHKEDTQCRCVFYKTHALFWIFCHNFEYVSVCLHIHCMKCRMIFNHAMHGMWDCLFYCIVAVLVFPTLCDSMHRVYDFRLGSWGYDLRYFARACTILALTLSAKRQWGA